MGWRFKTYRISSQKCVFMRFSIFLSHLKPLETAMSHDRSQVAPGRKEVVEAPSICPEFQDHLINPLAEIVRNHYYN